MNSPKLNGGHGLPFEILKWSLLVYTGYRSWDILASTMPTDNKLIALPGLLGLDVGVLVWSYLYEKKAEGNQATLAALLVVTDIIGVGLCLVADALMHSAQAADYQAFITAVSIWLVSAIIFFNVVGGILYPMMSPQAERLRKEKEIAAAYKLKEQEAEHDFHLAQLELANARTMSEARRLRLQATDTLYLSPASAAPSNPTPTPAPITSMAKDAPRGPLSDDGMRLELMLDNEDYERFQALGGENFLRDVVRDAMKKQKQGEQPPKDQGAA